MLAFIPVSERRCHDAYHHFFQSAFWTPDALFDLLARQIVRALCPSGYIMLDIDDTLHHKAGRKVTGVGVWRDAVRSTSHKVVYALGLNLIVLTIRITPPWGGFPIALPVRVRLHRKEGHTYIDLAGEMIGEIAALLPGCQFQVCADGFYASLATRMPGSITFTSRMRRDAALHDQPRPRPAGTRGRKPKKGSRLPKPPEIAREAAALGLFSRTTMTRRQEVVERLVYSCSVIWDGITVLLVIVRDPEGHEEDDYFFTTDLSACALEIPDLYGGRWSIEITFRDVKQLLGGQQPQCWTGDGPIRAASLAYWLYGFIWYCFLVADTAQQRRAVQHSPWYTKKSMPSFADALALLRRSLWWARINSRALNNPALGEIDSEVEFLIDQCSRAA